MQCENYDGKPDSSTALRVMQLVSSVASRGTTVVCSVHQPRPEVVRLLNKVSFFVCLTRSRFRRHRRNSPRKALMGLSTYEASL